MLFYINIYLTETHNYKCNATLGKKIAFGQLLLILPKIALLKLFDIVQARIYSSLYTRMSNSVLKFIFPREYI